MRQQACSGNLEMSPLGKIEMSPFGSIEGNLKRLLHGWESNYVNGVINYEHQRVKTIVSGSKNN